MRKIKNVVWRYMLKQFNYSRQCEHGIPIVLRDYADWFTFNEIFVDREYDLVIDMLLAKKLESLRILDLGANTGFFTFRCLEKIVSLNRDISSEFIMVEGSKSIFEILKKNCESIRIAKNKFTVIHALAGKKRGYGVLTGGKTETANRVNPDQNNFLRTKIDYADLDKFNDRKFDLIKCDIEGSEYDFLENYKHMVKACELLVIEFHGPPTLRHRSRQQLLDEYYFQSINIIREVENLSVEVFS